MHLFLEGLRGVLPMENPLPANMSQQRMERNQSQGIGGSQTNGVRCRWAAHERMNAVLSVVAASRRNRSQVRGRGIMTAILALVTWHCFASIFTHPISGCTSNVGAWKRKLASRV